VIHTAAPSEEIPEGNAGRVGVTTMRVCFHPVQTLASRPREDDHSLRSHGKPPFTLRRRVDDAGPSSRGRADDGRPKGKGSIRNRASMKMGCEPTGQPLGQRLICFSEGQRLHVGGTGDLFYGQAECGDLWYLLASANSGHQYRALIRWARTAVELTDSARGVVMLYVSDGRHHAVVELENVAPDARSRALSPAWPAGDLLDPAGVVLAPDGRLVIVDRGHQRLVVLSPDRAAASMLSPDGDPIGSLWRPTGVALGPALEVLIADTGNHRIVRCDSLDGGGWSAYSSRAGERQFIAPTGIAVESTGRITVADPGAGSSCGWTPSEGQDRAICRCRLPPSRRGRMAWRPGWAASSSPMPRPPA
jgi:hypothetical protein